MHEINPLATNIPHHVETSQFELICIGNQSPGLYVIGNIGR